ncbi:MAG: hypothetical protein Q9160_004900 [Pyrenula sp. 1 TL-2023]
MDIKEMNERLSSQRSGGKPRTFQSLEALQQHIAEHKFHNQHPPAGGSRANDNGKSIETIVNNTKHSPEGSHRANAASMVKTDTSPEGSQQTNIALMIKTQQSPEGARGNNAASGIKIQPLPQGSRWTDIAPSRRMTELTSLVRKIHSHNILKKYRCPLGNCTSPEPCQGMPKIPAVALDCEMVATRFNPSELVRLTAIDYLTSEVLIDSLVKPKERVINWRSTITGITSATMASAEAQGKVLYGYKEAQKELWKYVDSNTVLVGHAMENDFKALKITHLKVVDSGILASQAVSSKRRQFALNKLCEEFMAKPIRQRPNATHDSLEDAFAAREIVLWCLHNEEALRQWGTEKKKAIEAKNRRRRSRQKQKAMEVYESTDEDSEIPRWSDIAEAAGWPHPDTGYDPWSD